MEVEYSGDPNTGHSKFGQIDSWILNDPKFKLQTTVSI
jgi:hypothetical protein